MKKRLLIILVLITSITFSSCGNKSDEKLKSAELVVSGAEMESDSNGVVENATDYLEESKDYSLENKKAEIPEDKEDESWKYKETESDEEYDTSKETPFKDVKTSPLSTFSSDIDTASYSNMRRFINDGVKPEGIRIEELINYFDYNYKYSANRHPFSVYTELSGCPWNEKHQLAMITVKGEEYDIQNDIANNIVFLLDVSGSMDEDNKLPLLKKSFSMLIETLGENDIISVITYAGSDKILADSVPATEKRKLLKIMDNLSAAGSTAGANGIRSAYDLAEKNFIKDGNNRIILATDGDFNVGESSEDALIKLIESKRDRGVFMSVLGFGMYNLKDNMMESIADNGNGNYAYIDTLSEAKKVLVDEFDSMMYPIAKDLKFQVEFNPAIVKQYRLIGYNNRRLENEDFNDDRKDAGDIGAGHTVTAFYELILQGEESVAEVDDLRYQQTDIVDNNNEVMTLKIRYKKPDENDSKLLRIHVLPQKYDKKGSENFQFASSVAEFGLILTDSDYRGESKASHVKDRANKALGKDEYGLRKEFIELVEKYEKIAE